MITLLGTGHVFNLRERVQEEIHRRAPTVVALELDPARFQALRNPPKDRSGTPFVYRMLADFQKRIAQSYGVEAGDEMLAGAEAAQNVGARLALVDRDVQVTFQRLFREMGWGEKFRLFGSAVASAFLPGKMVEDQVAEMEKDYTRFFEALGTKYPTVKRVLLDERNEYMAERIAKLAEEHPNLVAVLGDGHVDGMRDILEAKGLDVETVRLKELRKPSPHGTGGASGAGGAGSTFGFSVRVDAEPMPEVPTGGLGAAPADPSGARSPD